jgi:electron transport complex protein RnfB
VVAGNRVQRIEARERNPRWRPPAVRIEMSECINCDACLRHCPPQFGAIFNHGIDVIVIPELCSGCGKCLPACPVDCIYDDPQPAPTPDDWWALPLTQEDPYVRV